MASGAYQQNGLILVAVSFDDRSVATVESAAVLADRCNMSMRLVHVVPSFYDREWTEDLDGAFMSELDLELANAEDERAVRVDLLHQLRERLDRKISVSIAIRYGDPVGTLIDEAMVHGAQLLVAGFSGDRLKGLLPGSLSVPFGILQKSPLPVLLLNDGASVGMGEAGFRMLLADDLSDGSSGAVRMGIRLAEAIGDCHVTHLHVEEKFSGTIRRIWRYMRQRGLSKDGGAGLQVKPNGESGIVANDHKVRELDSRAQACLRSWSDDDCRVLAELRQGGVRREILGCAAEKRPHLVVFGRHQMIHTKPFSIGKMPFTEMMSVGCSILVVPPILAQEEDHPYVFSASFAGGGPVELRH